MTYLTPDGRFVAHNAFHWTARPVSMPAHPALAVCPPVHYPTHAPEATAAAFAPQGVLGALVGHVIGNAVGGLAQNPQLGDTVGSIASTVGTFLPFSAMPESVIDAPPAFVPHASPAYEPLGASNFTRGVSNSRLGLSSRPLGVPTRPQSTANRIAGAARAGAKAAAPYAQHILEQHGPQIADYVSQQLGQFFNGAAEAPAAPDAGVDPQGAGDWGGVSPQSAGPLDMYETLDVLSNIHNALSLGINHIRKLHHGLQTLANTHPEVHNALVQVAKDLTAIPKVGSALAQGADMALGHFAPHPAVNPLSVLGDPFHGGMAAESPNHHPNAFAEWVPRHWGYPHGIV